jgi:hypothetical protein
MNNLKNYVHLAIVCAGILFLEMSSASPPSTSSWGAGGAKDSKVSLPKPPPLATYSPDDIRRNPFFPVPTPTPTPLPPELIPTPTPVLTHLNLRGIIAGNQTRLANIGGKLYAEGEWAGPAQILKIKPEYIQYRVGKRIFIQKLKSVYVEPGNGKTPAKGRVKHK